MPEISFNVSARTARLIGLENFANSEGAIIELVKNCYDADATVAMVFFDQSVDAKEPDSIVIIDNGTGMTSKIIEDNWMLIGTNNKEADAKSDKSRVRSGAKGIGRFALDKLGVKAEMITLGKNQSKGSQWLVNWDDFLKPNVVLSEIKAILEEMPIADFKSIALKYSENNSRMSDIINKHDFGRGTIIKITNLRDKWSEADLEKLYNNLELLIPPREQADFSISLFSKQYPKKFGDVPTAYYDDFDYKVSAKTSDKNNQILNVTLIRNELNLKDLLVKYPEFFQDKTIEAAGITLSTFDKASFEYQVKLTELMKGYADLEEGKEQLNKIGAFEFTCYFLKNTISDDSDSGKYPYKSINSGNRKAWLKKFGGIKIFRDGFRVRPYGEYGQDWLLLGERQAQSPQGAGQRLGGYRLGPNQVSGAINISRLTNISFQDKSGREGIQENVVFDVFKQVITNLISQIERDRNIVMFTISQIYKKKNKEAEAKRKADELAQKAIDDAQKAAEQATNETPDETQTSDQAGDGPNASADSASATEDSNLNQVVLDLAKGFQAQKTEIQEKDDEIRLLRALAGTGLIVASFAHELRNISPLLVTRVESLEAILRNKVDPDAFKNLKDYEQPMTILGDIKSQDKLIKHWLEYALSALKKDKRTRTNIDLIDYFYGYESKWKSILDKRLITMTFHKPQKIRPSLRGFTVDLDTIFNNMLTNSLESFKKLKAKTERKITIRLSADDENIKIEFEDNGAGLSKDFKNPDDIFLPFETSKVDKSGQKTGTGIGMYLTKSIIEDYDGTIKVLKSEPGFNLGITLPVKFKRNGTE